MTTHTAPLSRRDEGFTLVELLIVIVILGVLSTVTVFAVSGITDRGSDSASDSDKQTIVHAQEAYMAQNGVYADETVLVSGGLLRSASTTWDVDLATDNLSYSLVAEGSGPATTLGPPWATGTVVTTTFAGLPVEQYGNGPATVVLVGSDTDYDTDWSEFTDLPAPTGYTFYRVVGPDLDTVAELHVLLDAADFQIVAGSETDRGAHPRSSRPAITWASLSPHRTTTPPRTSRGHTAPAAPSATS